ncbi:TolB family protein [Neobacillus drentensis]|uniref:TolB family protein n=1 Tax=Neobacillus drentensis TaxID=220684 RepID=UPI000826DF8F|nr:hypothetical protein [Neobacillus drentensis]
MKRQLSSLVVATAVLAGSLVTPIALNEVKAATVQQNQSVSKEKMLVNGQFKNVQFKVINKKKLYSSADLGKLMSTSVVHKQNTYTYTFTKMSGKKRLTLTLKAKSTTAVVNGKKVKIANAPRVVGKTFFVDAKSFINALGGKVVVDTNLIVSTNSTITFGTAKLNVDGQLKSIKTLAMAGKQWFSAGDFAKLSGATIKTDKSNQYYILKNKKTVKIGLNPFKVKGLVYADLNELVKAIGGDILNQKSGKFISIAGLISGDSYNPQWINNSNLLVGNDNDFGSSTYVINVNSKKGLLKINGTDLSVSQDGKQAVYSDENGKVYLVNLLNNKISTLNANEDSPKFNFVWSKDGTKVYFILGTKMDSIASINIKDGAINPINSDKLTSKADLTLSPDGKKLLYTAGKEGTTNYTDPDKTDVTDIDLTNTESQLFVVDMTAAEVQSVALTTTPDNKAFPAFLPNGNIVYTSYDADGVKLPILNVIGAKNAIASLVTGRDIATATVSAKGKLIIVVNEKDGLHTIYEVNTTSLAITKLAQTKLEISSVSVAPDGKRMAITVPGQNGDRVMVINNGQFESVTK